jgi:serine/threonine-protein kinase HipA
MAIIDTTDIFYEQFAVGNLRVHDDGSLTFGYDPRWLATTGNFPLSVTLPLVADEFADPVVEPWLANLLPEEQQLTALSRALGVSSSDALAILKEIGGDTAGAISISEPSIRADWTYEALTEHYGTASKSEALWLHFDDLAQRPFLVGEDGVRLSLAGGQQKTALAVLGGDGNPKLGLPRSDDIIAVPKTGAPSTIIIKPDNPRLPGIVENEAFCLTLAGMIGLPVVESMVLTAGERTALAVARYDRRLRRDGTVVRLHQEDFAQANGIFPGQKYEQGTIPGLDLQRLLRTGAHLPPAEALRLLDQVIFNILVANTDAHAKNYSMILGGGPRLAPLYDVSTVLFWDHVNQYHAQKLAGRKRKPGDMARRHWEQIAEEAGLNARALRLRVQELVDLIVAKRVEATDKVKSQPGVSAEMVEHVAEIIEANALRIAGRLEERH